MRIFLDDQAFHIETRGGVSRHMALLARSLSECPDGPEVHLFAGWCHNRFALELPRTPRLHVYRLPRPKGLRITGLAKGISGLWRRRTVASLLGRPAPLVYHGSFYPLDPVIARRAALTVCTIHDMIPEMRGMRGRWADRYRREKEAATRLADRVVSISESTSADLLRLMPWTAGKTHTIPNSTDLFATRSSQIDPVYPKKHYFMMVGRRDDYKNGGMALRAFARLAQDDKRLGLVLCGGKPVRAEEQLLDQLGIADRVKHIAPGDSWLRSHYEHAVGLLYPSRHEGFGLPVLEAMLCGCPVVTTPLSSLPEVGGEAALYADADDVDAWARCMRELMHPERHALLVRRGLERAQRFRPEVQADAVLGLYRAALAARRA